MSNGKRQASSQSRDGVPLASRCPIHATPLAVEACRRILEKAGVRQLVLRLDPEPELAVRVPGQSVTAIPAGELVFFVPDVDLEPPCKRVTVDWSPRSGFRITCWRCAASDTSRRPVLMLGVPSGRLGGLLETAGG